MIVVVVALLVSRRVLRVDTMLSAITRHAGTSSKEDTKDAVSLGTAQFCYIGFRIGWMSALLCTHVCRIIIYSKSKDQRLPIPLVVS